MLQVIKAKEVRDGEPRWYCRDTSGANAAIAANAVALFVPSDDTLAQLGQAVYPLAIVDRPAPTPTPAPGLDLDALDEVRRIVEAIEHGSAPESDSEAHRWMSLLAREVAAMRWVDESQRRQCDALIAEVRALRAEVAKLNDRETGWRDMVDDECRKRISAEYDARAEIARLTAELAAARAEVDCGQDGPCAQAPGCARHWQERNRELVDELAAARAVPGDVEAAIVSDATAARGTVGGLLATAPECPTWCATHDPRDMATAMDGDRRYASPECRDAGRCLTRGPLPKGG